MTRTIRELQVLLQEFPSDWTKHWCANLDRCNCVGAVNCCINTQLASRHVTPITEEEWRTYIDALPITPIKEHIVVS